jgi:hypothetical protein
MIKSSYDSKTLFADTMMTELALRQSHKHKNISEKKSQELTKQAGVSLMINSKLIQNHFET